MESTNGSGLVSKCSFLLSGCQYFGLIAMGLCSCWRFLEALEFKDAELSYLSYWTWPRIICISALSSWDSVASHLTWLNRSILKFTINLGILLVMDMEKRLADAGQRLRVLHCSCECTCWISSTWAVLIHTSSFF